MMKKVLAIAAVMLLMFAFFAGTVCFAEGEDTQATVTQTEEAADSNTTSTKAIAAAACVAIVAAVGALSMGIAISKSVDGISRQPEAESKIRTALMLGLVFIETAVIYSLIIAILIIFVL